MNNHNFVCVDYDGNAVYYDNPSDEQVKNRIDKDRLEFLMSYKGKSVTLSGDELFSLAEKILQLRKS